MAIRKILMISMMVLISFGGLAQKPQKTLRVNPEGSRSLRSSYDQEARMQVKEERLHPLRRAANEDRAKPYHSLRYNRLKAEPIPASAVEKLDSLIDLFYDPDSMIEE